MGVLFLAGPEQECMMVMREEACTHSSISRRSIRRSTRVRQEAEGAREDAREP